MVTSLRMTLGGSRRAFLKESAATGIIIAPFQNYLNTNQNTIRIKSNGGGFAVYEFTVSGSVRQEDRGDQATGNRVYGHVGPKRGTDTFTYSGDITGLELAGPATLTVNGSPANPRNFPYLPESLTPQNLPQGNHRLRIESGGSGVAAYEFTVNGSVSQEDSGDQMNGNHVYGHVGPKRGTDTFTYSGTITQFVLTGPATLYIDGQKITSQTNPSDQTDPQDDSSKSDTAADPVEEYRRAVEGMNSLAENPGDPNEEVWFAQFQTHSEQAQDTLSQLVEKDYQFSVDVDNELTIQIEEPGQAAGLGAGRTPILTLTFGLAAIKASAMLKAGTFLTATAGGAWVVGATQTVTVPSASQAISTFYSTPWVYLLAQQNRQQVMTQGLRCLIANQAASQVAEEANTPQLESWAEEILEKTGNCPGSFNKFHNLAQDVFNVIESSTSGGVGQLRRIPQHGTITVAPGTTVLFEAIGPDQVESDVSYGWSVDGKEKFGPYALYDQIPYERGGSALMLQFDKLGTHEVEAGIYESIDKVSNIDSVQWVVEVESGGNNPPIVERVTPSSGTVRFSRNRENNIEFQLRAEDSTGLDRVIWWINQCDAVLGTSSLGGTSDTASVSFDVQNRCPLRPIVVDNRGAMTWFDGWEFEEENQ